MSEYRAYLSMRPVKLMRNLKHLTTGYIVGEYLYKCLEGDGDRKVIEFAFPVDSPEKQEALKILEDTGYKPSDTKTKMISSEFIKETFSFSFDEEYFAKVHFITTDIEEFVSSAGESEDRYRSKLDQAELIRFWTWDETRTRSSVYYDRLKYILVEPMNPAIEDWWCE